MIKLKKVGLGLGLGHQARRMCAMADAEPKVVPVEE